MKTELPLTPNRANFQQGISASNKPVIYSILEWLLPIKYKSKSFYTLYEEGHPLEFLIN